MLREKEKKQRVAEKNGHRLPDKTIHGLNGYRPFDKEPFMGERQRAGVQCSGEQTKLERIERIERVAPALHRLAPPLARLLHTLQGK